jgi:hypothetical protein
MILHKAFTASYPRSELLGICTFTSYRAHTCLMRDLNTSRNLRLQGFQNHIVRCNSVEFGGVGVEKQQPGSTVTGHQCFVCS